jgi:hypothetical protein
VTFKHVGALMVVAGLSMTDVAAAAGSDEKPALGRATVTLETSLTLPKSVPSMPATKRPILLPSLYATLGAMQGWDIYSTSKALNAGAREVNGTVAPVASNAGALIGLKAATTAGTILCAEKMWKKNRAGSVALMAVINGATAAVAMHNMHNARLASTVR